MKNLENIESEATKDISAAQNMADLESSRVKHLGRKSKLSLFLRGLKKLAKDEKKTMGQLANDIRNRLELEIKKREIELKEKEISEKIDKERIDITRPGEKVEIGHLHPLTRVFRETKEIFGSLGFYIVDGPELETEYYNFDALNIPASHPSRELMDTFWLRQPSAISHQPSAKLLLRTHTSPMQIRFMEKHTPPFRIIVPGRVFRHEATDAGHEIQFHQLEGLMVSTDTSFTNLKGILEYFFKKFFSATGGKDIDVRFVPSYFPFTEPSVEVLIKWGDKRFEVAGAGMVHQNVFRAVGYTPWQWQGFAFGMGIDRLAMIKYRINDIRLFYGGDLRFLKQF